MITKEYKITDPIGIHARPASLIVQSAKKFKCKMTLLYKDKKADLTSILSIMSLGVLNNSIIKITYDGADEGDAANNIENVLIKSKLISK